MSLENKIMPDLKTAMKSKDQAALRSIRAIKAAILLTKTDGSGKELDEAGEIKLLQKLVKQRQDSLDIFCLLYTSPSPRDRTRSRMPSSA